ncbi:hypothetical protein [Actinacidiphila glaucinigra]|uniref:hypothetical protein n=1 Tax=Actinacidiphila glaucinigra TaxID=235986 RepID=UPI0035E052EB
MYPNLFTTPGLANFAEAVDQERQRQLAKFGDQRHADGTGSKDQKQAAEAARNWCEDAFASGYGTWADILDEEVAEAKAEDDPAQLRAELVQIAAVCAAWVADLDTRIRPEAQPVRTAGGIVGYRSRDGRLLRCMQHAPGQSVLDSGDLTPVTSDDLPDGGVCTYPDCGRDVLSAALDDRLRRALETDPQ